MDSAEGKMGASTERESRSRDPMLALEFTVLVSQHLGCNMYGAETNAKREGEGGGGERLIFYIIYCGHEMS